MSDAPFLSGTNIPPPSKDRLGALWAFTRAQREANPAGYDNNVRWWGGALGAILAKGAAGPDKDTLVLRCDDDLLYRVVNGAGGRPRGIAGVIDQLSTQTGPFIPLPHFLDSPTPIEATQSIVSRVVGAGWGVLARLSPFGGESTEDGLWKKMKGKEFVYLPNVKAASTAFEERTADQPPINYTDALYTRASFLKEFATITSAPLTKRDVDVLLRWLVRDVGVIVVDNDVVKLLTAGQVPAEHPITEADKGALSVRSTLARIEAQIADIEAQAAQVHLKAKGKLAAGQRTAAASYLRSKKQLDDVLVKRLGAAEQLRSVVRALDQAKGDAEVMSAYEASTAALASALSDPRLSPDRIASTTDALADALADQKEIDDAIQLGGKLASPEFDEDELEKELAALVLEDKEEKEREKAAAEAERQKAEKEAAERQRAEKAKAEEKAEKERLEREEAQRKAEARLASIAAPAPAPSVPNDKPASWEDTHAAAQDREREEKARAEAERLKKEEQRLVAE